MEKIFFHPMVWDNDVYIMYIVWPFALVLVLYILRFLYNMVRSKYLIYKKQSYYMVRDLFLSLAGMEYLIVFNLLFAIYLGFWFFLVKPVSADWTTLPPYLIVLPQVVTIITTFVLFFIRYNKFRNPLIRK